MARGEADTCMPGNQCSVPSNHAGDTIVPVTPEVQTHFFCLYTCTHGKQLLSLSLSLSLTHIELNNILFLMMLSACILSTAVSINIQSGCSDYLQNYALKF